MEEYFKKYMEFVGETEAPTIYHRWASISLLGAMLERDVYFKLGHFDIYPNMYIMLIGVAAARKSSAIKIAKKALEATGFDSFAPEEVSREQFLVDLHDLSHTDLDESILEENIFGNSSDKDYLQSLPDAVTYIAADEFNDFIGLGNLQFISLLGTLWDYKGVYSRKLKNSKRVEVNNPTVSILGGNTPTGFSSAFPAETLGQGFFSRLLLIYGEPTGIKHTFLADPCSEAKDTLVNYLGDIKEACSGRLSMTQPAAILLDKIYKTWEDIPDVRFVNYSGRRFTHLLKLCMLVTCSRCSSEVSAEDVRFANTLLIVTEHKMPKALGEFGKGRHSAVTNKILDLINGAKAAVSVKKIIGAVHSDVDNLSQVLDLLKGLEIAQKIQLVDGLYLPKHAKLNHTTSDVFDLDLLNECEQL